MVDTLFDGGAVDEDDVADEKGDVDLDGAPGDNEFGKSRTLPTPWWFLSS